MTDEQYQGILQALEDIQTSNLEGLQTVSQNLDFIVKLGLLAFVMYFLVKMLWRFMSPVVYD